jgi:hypothetical protein
MCKGWEQREGEELRGNDITAAMPLLVGTKKMEYGWRLGQESIVEVGGNSGETAACE